MPLLTLIQQRTKDSMAQHPFLSCFIADAYFPLKYPTMIKSLKDSILSWDLVAHPVTEVIGEQALVDILHLSEVAWTLSLIHI